MTPGYTISESIQRLGLHRRLRRVELDATLWTTLLLELGPAPERSRRTECHNCGAPPSDGPCRYCGETDYRETRVGVTKSVTMLVGGRPVRVSFNPMVDGWSAY